MKAISETEWFNTSYTPDDLRQQYLDTGLTVIRREHAFYRYWNQYATLLDGEVTDEDVAELLKFRSLFLSADEIIELLSQKNVLTHNQIVLLTRSLPENTYGSKNVSARRLLQDNHLTWRDKLPLILSDGIDWAAHELLSSLSSDDHSLAKDMIVTSTRPKRVKSVLLQILTT